MSNLVSLSRAPTEASRTRTSKARPPQPSKSASGCMLTTQATTLAPLSLPKSPRTRTQKAVDQGDNIASPCSNASTLTWVDKSPEVLTRTSWTRSSWIKKWQVPSSRTTFHPPTVVTVNPTQLTPVEGIAAHRHLMATTPHLIYIMYRSKVYTDEGHTQPILLVTSPPPTPKKAKTWAQHWTPCMVAYNTGRSILVLKIFI